jgi:hypothetical protein
VGEGSLGHSERGEIQRYICGFSDPQPNSPESTDTDNEWEEEELEDRRPITTRKWFEGICGAGQPQGIDDVLDDNWEKDLLDGTHTAASDLEEDEEDNEDLAAAQSAKRHSRKQVWDF